MRVRFAERADVDAVVEMGERMFDLSRFRRFRYSRERSRQAVEHAVTNPAWMLAVAETSGGELAGFHMAHMAQYFFCDEWMAESVLYFVAPERRGTSAALKLLRIFERWGQRRGAREVVLGTGVSEGAPLARTDRFLRRAGIRQVGGLYGRWLE